MKKPGLAIGWDVGGWLGKKQGVAIIEIDPDGAWRFVGVPTTFSIAALADRSVFSLIRLGWLEAPSDALERYRIAIAIDSPLNFPVAFQRLLSGKPHTVATPKTEIESTLAYRACDQYVYLEYGKKPLSASFDKLGNNATVAMVFTQQWRDLEGFRTIPFEGQANHEREILEVYPTLVKSRNEGIAPHVRAHLPATLEDKTDEQDAAICALLAAARIGVKSPSLPALVQPPLPVEQWRDGWIYAFSKEWTNNTLKTDHHD
jgi:Protein of unknown function (DUF429)